MLYICVGDVMDVVFSVWIVRYEAVGAVYGKCGCFVMQMYVCVLCASCGRLQCSRGLLIFIHKSITFSIEDIPYSSTQSSVTPHPYWTTQTLRGTCIS